MRRPALGSVLAATNAALVLAAVAGAGFGGVLALRRLSDEQALARVALAGAAASHEIAAEEARIATAARLLTERPTLRRLLDERRSDELSSFLDAFGRTSQLAGSAVTTPAGTVATSGDLDWDWLATLPAGRHASPPAQALGPPVLLARAPLSTAGGAEVLVVSRLDEAFAAAVALKVGLPVKLTSSGSRTLRPDDAATERRSDAYVDVRLVSGSGGAPIAALETRLGAAAVDASLRRVRRTLLLFAVAAAGIVLAVGLWLSRAVARPLARLGDAARRLGRGDLKTPVSRTGGGEVEELAATLEDSRQRLLDLTTELRQREAEARALLEGIVEGVYAVDDARRITYLSPQAAASLGIEPERALGRFCGDVLRPLEQDGKLPCQDDCPIVHARSRGSARAFELVRGAASSPLRVAITSSPPVDGRQVQVLREETAEEGNRRLRDNILANLTHELRTPLAAQLASIELLGDGLGKLPPAETRELVEALERSTLRLTRLIDNLLASVRLESGSWPASFGPVGIDKVAREAGAVLSPLLLQRRQALRFAFPERLPPVRGDRTQLTHALLNLLANANRFAPDDSTITISAALADAGVTVSVEDEGPGLPGSSSAQPDLFRRWSQPAEGPGGQGVGLGLSIVRAVVERHQGSVTAETRASGGARFTLTIPLHRDEAEAVAS